MAENLKKKYLFDMIADRVEDLTDLEQWRA